MCFSSCTSEDRPLTSVSYVLFMDYPLPGPVVALLQQENASLSPKSYFISSGKKSIKITLVYAKGEQPPCPATTVGADKKKSRHSSSSKTSSKNAGRRTRSKNLSESSSSVSNSDKASGSVSQSEAEQSCVSPDLHLLDSHSVGRARMSTVDSGHPSSSCTVANDVQSESGSDGGDEGGESFSSSDSEKPRTPGRDIAVPASSIGPGETPAAMRDEIWQTWTRIPRTQAISRHLLTAPVSTVRRSMSPSTATVTAPRAVTATTSQRRPRLHEGVSWDGSGNL